MTAQHPITDSQSATSAVMDRSTTYKEGFVTGLISAATIIHKVRGGEVDLRPALTRARARHRLLTQVVPIHRQGVFVDHLGSPEEDRTPHHMRQLADVPWPRIAEKSRLYLHREAG
jgi:hypothetical protein